MIDPQAAECIETLVQRLRAYEEDTCDARTLPGLVSVTQIELVRRELDYVRSLRDEACETAGRLERHVAAWQFAFCIQFMLGGALAIALIFR